MDITQTLAERGARYGNFAEHAEIAQDLQDAMRGTAGWERLAADQRQALTVIADKIARMLNGDPDYVDNWHDIIGYARLVEQRLEADAAHRASPLGLLMQKATDAMLPGIVESLTKPNRACEVLQGDDSEEASAPYLPVSDEVVAAMAKNCVRLAQHLIDASARRTIAHRHALKLGENVASYVLAHFVELDAQVLDEQAAAQQVNSESRN